MFSQFLFLLNHRQRLKTGGLLLLMFVGMLLEMLGVGLVLPIIGLLATNETHQVFERLGPAAQPFKDIPSTYLVPWAMGLLAATYLAKNIYIGFLAWIQARFIFHLHASLSQRVFRHYLDKRYSFFLSRHSSQLIKNIIFEVNLFTNGFQSTMVFATELLVIGGLSILLFFFEPVGTIAALGSTLIAALIFTVLQKVDS